MKAPAVILAALSFLAATEAAPPPAPAMQELAPGVFQIGKMRLDKNKRSVAFPGKLNMDKDLLEYLIVTPGGSTHESLLVTEIQPTDLHFAMLLLGAKGAGLLAPQPKDSPPGQINAEYLRTAPQLKGDNLTITVTWKAPEGEQTVPVEDWLMDPETESAAPRGPWIYNGSMFGEDGSFVAEQLGMFAALVTNPGALINNPRKRNDDDRAWTVNQKAVPVVDTPVTITIVLQDGVSKTK